VTGVTGRGFGGRRLNLVHDGGQAFLFFPAQKARRQAEKLIFFIDDVMLDVIVKLDAE